MDTPLMDGFPALQKGDRKETRKPQVCFLGGSLNTLWEWS